MKKILLTLTLFTVATSPAISGTSLEDSLGVEAGVYTTAQLVRMTFAQSETGSGSRVYFSEDNGMSLEVSRIFKEIRASESGSER